MKWSKRMWLSIIRRPIKSLLIFLVVFIMSSLLAGALSIVQTSGQIKENLKASISPQISISYEKEYKYNKKKYVRSTNVEEMKEYISILDNMKKDENVLSSQEHYTLDIFAQLDDLGWDNDNKDEFAIELLSTNVIEPSYFIKGEHKLLSMQDNKFLTKEQLESNEIYLIVDHKVGSIREMFNPLPVSTGLNEIGNEVTLTIKSSSTYFDETINEDIPYEYKFKAKVAGVLFNKAKQPSENVAYISPYALMKVVDDANDYFNKIGVNKVAYELHSSTLTADSIEKIEEFSERNKDLINQLKDGFVYETSSEVYKKNVGPVENLDAIASIILVTAIVATFIVLGLIVVLSISERRKEIGIYSSVGESKKNIIYQILCEILLISTLAIGCSSVSGLFLGNKLSDYMLDVQRYVQREQQLGALAKVPVLYKPVDDGISLQNRDDVIDNYEVKPNLEYFVTIVIVSQASVLISCVIPIVYLSSLKPKEIML